MSNTNINELNIIYNNNINKIYQLKLELNKLEVMNDNIKEIMKQICKHNKIINHSSTNEKTEYICSICDSNL